MSSFSVENEQQATGADAVRLVSLVEVLDMFVAHVRTGVTALIERGDFVEPHQEMIGLTVWDREEVDRWFTAHQAVVDKLLVLTL